MNFKEEKSKITDTAARKRLARLFDDGSFTEIDAFVKSGDGQAEVVAGYGTVEGNPAYAFAQDSSVDGGAIGRAHGAKVKKVFEMASKTGAPVVGIYDSNGARLKEGIEALAAYGEMLALSSQISGVVPQISIIAGPCAGTAAMVAGEADFVILSKEAEYFLHAPCALSAEDCLAAGTADLLAENENDAIDKAREILAKLPLNNLAPLPLTEFAQEDSFLSGDCASLKADTLAVVKAMADVSSAIELKAAFGLGVHTMLGSVAGSSVGFVAFNGQAVDADTCDKAARFVHCCDAFNVPVITLVNTQGFEKAPEAEKAGMLRHASKLAGVYAEATTVKISVLTGHAVGAAYIALAGRAVNADLVFAWPCAVVSALEPDAAVAILYNDRLAAGEDRKALTEEYLASQASPLTAAAVGQVDDVFEPAQTRGKLISALEMLAGKRVSTLPKKHSNYPM